MRMGDRLKQNQLFRPCFIIQLQNCMSTGGCEITAFYGKRGLFVQNERKSPVFMLKLTCDENFNYKL